MNRRRLIFRLCAITALVMAAFTALCVARTRCGVALPTLRRDVWAYSQSKNYWGDKPWAPDPCYRENVMYTGHLLQLLALYECFTGDRGYWEKGFDFIWKDGRHVHYDVKRLIDVTVDQMRTNPSGGITCDMYPSIWGRAMFE